MGNKVIDIENEIEKLFEQFDNLISLRQKSLNQLSEADGRLSSLYHKIEGIEIKHISESHNLIKEMKVVLADRRLAKKNCMITQSVVDKMKGQMENAKNQSKSILNKHKLLEDEIRSRAKSE